MENEQTNKTDTQGAEANKPVAKPDAPLSLVEEAQKVRDEIKSENDRREEILKKEEALKANEMLGGTSGGHVEAPVVSEEELKKQKAAEFFKGTALEDAILEDGKK